MRESILYLMRHGSAAPERDGRVVMAGRTDYPLNSRGIGEFKAWAARFAAIRLEKVWSSPLTRAAQSAGLILAEQADPAPQLILEPALTEVSLGDWEGLASHEARRRWPELWAERGRDFAAVAPPGGENLNDLAGRVLPAFRRILAEAGKMKRCMVVAHQAVNRVILAELSGLPLSDIRQIPQDSAAMNVIGLRGGEVFITASNLAAESWIYP